MCVCMQVYIQWHGGGRGVVMWHNSVGGKMNILCEKNLIFCAQQILNY